MKYGKINLGQIEAIINKLGGEEGIQDFLAGKTKIVKVLFSNDLLNGKGIFTVSMDYNHDTQIDTFRARIKKLGLFSPYTLSNALRSKNFRRTTNKLKPGKTYRIKIFTVLDKNLNNKDCLEFLKQNKAILVGAQGLTALIEDQPEIFPRGSTASFGDRESHRIHGVPRTTPMQGNFAKLPALADLKINTGTFEGSWKHILCFCEIEE